MSAPGIDRDQIALFVDVVFSWCDGLIPLRGLPEKGVTPVPSNDLRWIPADAGAPEIMATAAEAAASVGRAIYVIPGTVGHNGEARAEHVRQMQALVVDLDEGDISAKRDHLIRNLGPATLTIESGGLTEAGQPKLHLWWKLTEPAEGEDLARLCRLRAAMALKVGGDDSFGSAHQPIRVPGTIHGKYGRTAQVRIVDQQPIEVDLGEFGRRGGDRGLVAVARADVVGAEQQVPFSVAVHRGEGAVQPEVAAERGQRMCLAPARLAVGQRGLGVGGDEGVEAEAGGERERELRDRAHEDREDAGDQGRQTQVA